jgi:hypothetical protein
MKLIDDLPAHLDAAIQGGGPSVGAGINHL